VVFGQDAAIVALSSAIKLARAGLREPEKPIGNYLFAGPTGVGKTEVAKQLAATSGVELCASTCRNTWRSTPSPA
jgi:ATP-dependent Clp protease ATP-binding subunit ClpA